MILLVYWIIFYHRIIFNPYLLSYGDNLYLFYPLERLCGEYWRKLKIPKDPYYYEDLLGARIGTLYPANIILSVIESILPLDIGFTVHVWNILLHQLATSIFAYYLFGGGYIGLFGALAWGYYSYHIKQDLFYVQGFTWITGTLCFIHLHSYLWAGISLGMLWLCCVPPMTIYFLYILNAFWLFYRSFPAWIFALGLLIALPQIIPMFKYNKKSIRRTYTYEDNVKVGRIPLWWYMTLFLPVKIRDFLFGVINTETAYYVTPLVFFFSFFSTWWYWIPVLAMMKLSRGGWLFKKLNRFMTQFPQRWGYFVGLFVIIMGVEGLKGLAFSDKQLLAINVVLAVMLLGNSSLMPHYPFNQWAKKPSYFFDTPLLRYLKEHAKGFRVNNLPYPIYTGHIHHIRSVGYCGSNHTIELNKIRNLPKLGTTGNDWFEFKKDGDDLDKFGIKYHVGNKPSDDPKWRKVFGFDLWENDKL
jgi:hypothetical protein